MRIASPVLDRDTEVTLCTSGVHPASADLTASLESRKDRTYIGFNFLQAVDKVLRQAIKLLPREVENCVFFVKVLLEGDAVVR